MYHDTTKGCNHVRFNLTEEKYIIHNLIRLDYLFPTSDEEKELITKALDILVGKGIDLHYLMWRDIHEMFDRHQIELRKTMTKKSRWHKYKGEGDGHYYGLFNRKSMTFDQAKEKRNKKRIDVFEESCEGFDEVIRASEKIPQSRDSKLLREFLEEFENIKTQFGIDKSVSAPQPQLTLIQGGKDE